MDSFFCAGAAASYTHSTTIDGVPAKQALQIIGVAGNTCITIAQSVESINCQFLIGQKMTLSALVYCPAGKTIYLSANSMNAKDVVGAVTSVASKAIVSIGGWQLVSMTFVATSDCRSNGMVVSFSATEGIQAGQVFYLTNAQLELGEYQTYFENRPYPIELRLCQRYYESGYFYSTGYVGIGAGQVLNPIIFKATKFKTPSISLYSVTYASCSSAYATQPKLDCSWVSVTGSATTVAYAHGNYVADSEL